MSQFGSVIPDTVYLTPEQFCEPRKKDFTIQVLPLAWDKAMHRGLKLIQAYFPIPPPCTTERQYIQLDAAPSKLSATAQSLGCHTAFLMGVKQGKEKTCIRKITYLKIVLSQLPCASFSPVLLFFILLNGAH